MVHKLVRSIVGFAERRAGMVVALALLLTAALANYARTIELRSDLLELLPRNSPAFRAFENQNARARGGTSLLVVVESPNRLENERFVDALAAKLHTQETPRNLISYVEADARDVGAFFDANKWLYASVEELSDADTKLDQQIAFRTGLVSDLDSPSESLEATEPKPKKEDALGMGEFLKKWEDNAKRPHHVPTGYFATDDGTLYGIRISANVGLGDAKGDRLLHAVERSIHDVRVESAFSPNLRVGLTGEIASAADEKKALVSEALWATLFAVTIVLVAIVLFFRTPWALPIVALPTFFGIAFAYAVAKLAIGYINSSGAFLGAIILGNGINYPIVLFARYQEFRARGMDPDRARSEAVINALRAELVGASVAAIAYGSLALTQFRGFNQFGAIGFIGMFAVWLAIVPMVPAAIVLVERVQAHLPKSFRWRPPIAVDGARNGFVTRVAVVLLAHPRVCIAVAAAVSLLACVKAPSYVRDPWEYDFGKLGSRETEVHGAGDWSNKANRAFGGKSNIAGASMIADTPQQVPLVKAKILENDARDPSGKLIEEITTIGDLLPGTLDEQQQKLAILESIRNRLTPAVISKLNDEERATAHRMRPPENLHVLKADDLPEFVRRRFSERNGTLGTVFYVRPREHVVFADGHNHLRLSNTTDNVVLDDGTVVQTASRSTIFAEMLRSMRRDGPLAAGVAIVAVAIVVVFAARNFRVTGSVLVSLIAGVLWLVGWAAFCNVRINYVNFVAIPITLGIGCEYPFNIADRTRLLAGDVRAALLRSGGAVVLCSFTTAVGYGSLLFSDFQALESFGALAVVGEIGCLFAALILLPALLFLNKDGGRSP